MTPSHTRKNGRKYRYYISASLVQGQPEKAGQIKRVPAEEIETLVKKFIRNYVRLPNKFDPKTLIEAHVVRVDVRTDRLVVELTPAGTEGLGKGRRLKQLTIPWRKTTSTRRREILLPEGITTGCPRPLRSETRKLLSASIAQRRRWLDELVNDPAFSIEKIAKRERCSPRKVNMTISLAFLAPDLVRAATEGCLPDGFGVVRLSGPPAE